MDSIRNEDGPYGHPAGGSTYDPYFNSDVSAYNHSAANPPKIVLDHRLVGWLSTNEASTSLDPDVLLLYLGCS